MVAISRPIEDAPRPCWPLVILMLACSISIGRAVPACAQTRDTLVRADADSNLVPSPRLPGDSTAVYLAPTMEVRARRRRRQEILDREGGFASVIHRSSWAGGLATAATVLSDAVGVTVREAGGLGAYSSVSIRGSTQAQVPIFLDGVPLAPPAAGGTNLADIPLESLNRIEVYRGAAPLVLGGASLGGAIHLVSARGREAPWTRTTMGSYHTLEMKGGASSTLGSWILLARARALRSRGDWSYDFDNRTPYNPSDDYRTSRINNDVQGGGGILSAVYRGERFDLQLTELLDGRDYGLPGRDLQAHDARSSSLTHHFMAALTPRPERSGVLRRVEVYHRLDQQGFQDRNGELGLTKQERRDRTHSLGCNLLGAFLPGRADAWRAELRWARLQSTRLWPEKSSGEPESRLTAAAALQPEFRALSQRLSLSPGVRVALHHDHVHGASTLGNYDLPEGPRKTSDIWAHTYQLDTRYLVSESLVLKFNLGEYERVPTLIERFGNRGSVMGNPQLTPEIGTNRDLGLVWSQPRSGRRAMVSVFHNDSSQLTTFVRNSQQTAVAQNVGAAEIKGLEVDLSSGGLGPLRLGFNGTWLRTRDRSDNASFRGNPLPGRPSYQLAARVRLRHRAWRLGYALTAMGDNTLQRNGREKIPSRLLHQVSFGWTIAGVTLSARVDNLTNDEQLFDLYGWPLPGRRFFLSLGIGGQYEQS